MRTILLLAPVLLIGMTAAAAEPAQAIDGWSKPVSQLSGRLIARDKVVRGRTIVELILELKNDHPIPKSVVTHSPFAFELTVRDADDKVVEPYSTRVDILFSSEIGVIPRDSYLGFPVTLDGDGGNLDITTHLWNLKPGKYTLEGKYSLPPPKKEKPWKPGTAQAWSGTLELPKIEIEITAAHVAEAKPAEAQPADRKP